MTPARVGKRASDRLVKICGATTPQEVRSLAATGADCVGLWHGVPEGSADLSERDLVALARATSDTATLEPVLVTFLSDAGRLAWLVERSGVRWIQLHAYQPPGVVQRLRTALPDCVIIKVLHVADGDCPELPLLDSYTRAGTDLFLIDRAGANGRLGSTGEQVSDQEVVEIAGRLSRPFLLAGGVTAHNLTDYTKVLRCPGFRGIDVDTGARGPDGTLSAAAVRELAHTWRGTGRTCVERG
ncbi:N-(5'-phosphoribosyl)anthranilate isomerase [Lipingzhangella sp. LS1_29]|uniref:N-(5'-phosphoribosyl)anthranilate isomerase n=1 Tax=Lipingzhangella rawalii TaxID=2055835 RepID=A0ABU2HBU2_9ACTN|nr:N-(5'-phosphoribosyl)anthranilate isomerase [Lipingzhangella rawalii]MDS1272462.1 N-(5'-phosphoribosyl)anthranilate isomerase [Lipingzhangella rawalii]